MPDQSLKIPSKSDLEYLREGATHQAMKMDDLPVPSNNIQAEVIKEALGKNLGSYVHEGCKDNAHYFGTCSDQGKQDGWSHRSSASHPY